MNIRCKYVLNGARRFLVSCASGKSTNIKKPVLCVQLGSITKHATNEILSIYKHVVKWTVQTFLFTQKYSYGFVLSAWSTVASVFRKGIVQFFKMGVDFTELSNSVIVYILETTIEIPRKSVIIIYATPFYIIVSCPLCYVVSNVYVYPLTVPSLRKR